MTPFVMLAAIFGLVGFVFLAIAAPTLALTLILVTVGLLFLFGIILGAIYAYDRLGKAKLNHAQTLATILEAAKIADNIQGLALPNNSKVQYIGFPVRPSYNQQQAALLPEAVQELGLPIAPTFSILLNSGFQAKTDKLLLGFNHAGPIYGDITALLSTAVAGRPGQGKSSLLRLVSAQMMMIDGLTVNLDPHGSISEDVPTALYTASTAKELDDLAAFLVKELESRLAAYRQGKRDFQPLMALNDEFPVISLSSKDAVAAISRVVLEGRKVKMFSLISGQGLPASQFGGSLVRDALSSRYIFQTTSRQGQMAGLDKDAVKLLDKLDIGRAILDGPVKPQIVAIPFVTTDDLANLTQGLHRESVGVRKEANPTSDMGNSFSESPGTSGKGYETIEANYRELPAVEPDIVNAYNAYKAGAKTVRAMQQALGCRTEKASELLATIKRVYGGA